METIRVMSVEWHRGLRSWRFWLTVALTVFLFVLAMYQFVVPHVPGSAPTPPNYYNFFTGYMSGLGAYIDSAWVAFLPILAALPSGDSLAFERLRGVDATIITRIGWRRYLLGKVLGNASLAGSATVVAMLITAVTAVMRFPIALPKLLGWTLTSKAIAGMSFQEKVSGVFASDYWPDFHAHLFWAHPWIYLVVISTLAIWATVAISGISIATSVWIRRPIVVLVIPTALFWAGEFLAQSGWSQAWGPSEVAGSYLSMGDAFSKTYTVPTTWWDLALYWAVPALAVVAVVSWVAVRRKEWPQRGGGL